MNFRNINVVNFSLGSEQSFHKSYMIADKVPVQIYREVLEWSDNEMVPSEMTITLSDNKGHKVLPVIDKPPVVVDGIGYCELELRGALNLIKPNKSIVITGAFLPVLHYSNGEHAMCMVLSDDNIDDMVVELLNDTIIPKLYNHFKDISLYEGDNHKEIDLTMTTYITCDKEAEDYMDNSRINIITTPINLNVEG